MFYYKTQFCPFNLTKHEPSKCVYAHNWQDYRRPPNAYSYQPIVPIILLSLASTGKQKTISPSRTITAAVKLESTAICATDGKNNNTILPTTKPLSARLKAAKKGHVLTITHRNKEELLTMISLARLSGMCPRTELLKVSLKAQWPRKGSK